MTITRKSFFFEVESLLLYLILFFHLSICDRYNARILEENVRPEKDGKENTADAEYYKVQLIDENSEGIDQDDCIKIVPADKIK